MASAVELVRALARDLVDNPDEVEADWAEIEGKRFIKLTVKPSDRGRVIGRRGRTIQSLRQLATAAFGGPGEAVSIELNEQ
jgi:predicted RNA-binding protein YlqC (UPF0109 family)